MHSGCFARPLAVVVVFTLAVAAQASLLLYEPFSSTSFPADDTKLGRVSGQWNLGNNTDAFDGWSAVRSTAAMSYSSLVTSNGSRGVARLANTYAANRNIGAPWATAVTAGSVYCSFLVNVTGAPAANRALLALSFFASGNISGRNDGCGAVAWLNPNRQLQVGKYSTSVLAPGTTPALDLGVTYLVVLKYTFNTAAGDDEVALYLNPLTAEPEPGSPTIATTAGTDSSSMKSVWLPQSQSPEFGSSTGEILMDEIRVGDTWADVVVADGAPPPALPVPHITQVFLAGPNLVLQGTNGPPTGTYRMLNCDDVSRPVTEWSAVATGYFDTNGNFSFTNGLSPAAAEKFYRVQVLASGPVTGPGITGQPQDLAVGIGQSAVFNVAASGTAPLTYDWYFNTNTLLASGPSATLTITNAQLADAGKYSVSVSNLVGSAQSVFATLTVTNNTQPPGILAQPTNQSVMTGAEAMFNVAATGTAPLRYQWYFNTNTILGGQTNSALTLSNAQPGQSGNYSVTVTNLYGMTNSAFATLLVTNSTAPAGIAIPPASLNVVTGQTAIFNVTASGALPLRYQWYFNTNTLLADQTNTTLTLTNVQLSDAGTYSVTVTNLYGAANSTFATLTVSEEAARVKPRIIATTDGEVDDQSSMVRFLMYSCDFDVVGIVANNSIFQKSGHGRAWIDAKIDLYAQVRTNLIKHHPDYPTPEYLKSVIRIGNENSADLHVAPPNMATKNTPGEQLMIQTLLDSDPRPVHVPSWGGANTTASALWRLKTDTNTYTPAQYQYAVSRIRVYAICYNLTDKAQDDGIKWIIDNLPEVEIFQSAWWSRTWNYSSVGSGSYSPVDVQAYMTGEWLTNNVQTGHGPLGAGYPQTYVSEGDTPSWLDLINNGLEADEDYTLGGWGGRAEYQSTNSNWMVDSIEDPSESTYRRYAKAFYRWIPAAQNDFAARMDWCVATNFAGANHQPVARFVGSLQRDVSPGQTVTLDASPSSDPDGNALTFNWWQYYESDSAATKVSIANSNSMTGASFVVPNEPGKLVHIILEVIDNGTPPLTGYQRIICNIQ